MPQRVCVALSAGVALATVLLASPSAGATEPSRCVELAIPRGAVAAHDGSWVELTADQWQFLRGVYVLHPRTAAGMPFGGKAALAQIPGDEGGMVFFIDGETACSPMPVPRALIDLLRVVGEIAHEGEGS